MKINTEEMYVVDDYDEPTFVALWGIGIAFTTLIAVGVIAVIVQLKTIFFPQTLNISEPVLNPLFIALIGLAGFVVVIIGHEILHAVPARMYGIPTRFVVGRKGLIPYAGVSLGKPIGRNQFIWIALVPNVIINTIMVIFLLVANSGMIWSYVLILFIAHVAGGGVDALMIYMVSKYPSSILIADSGPTIQILAPEPLERVDLLNKDSWIYKGIIFAGYFFLALFLIVPILGIVLISAYNANIPLVDMLIVSQTDGSNVFIGLRPGTELLLAFVVASTIWLIRTIKRR
ncbi:MAG: DUF3267 domain-containing protein [Candidatus Hodarchaeota archaeon]